MRKQAAEQLSEYLSGQGLKSTRQRDDVLNAFVSAGRHLSAEELYLLVKKSNPGIGYATVYRTLKLLAEAGLADERRFEDGFTATSITLRTATTTTLSAPGAARSSSSRTSASSSFNRTWPGRTASRSRAINWSSTACVLIVKDKGNDHFQFRNPKCPLIPKFKIRKIQAVLN